jgi:hypothetical protein
VRHTHLRNHGDSYDNAMEETINTLYKAKVIWCRGAAWKRWSTQHWNKLTSSTTGACWSHWRHSTSGVRTGILSSTGVSGLGRMTLNKKSPKKPRRFTHFGIHEIQTVSLLGVYLAVDMRNDGLRKLCPHIHQVAGTALRVFLEP